MMRCNRRSFLAGTAATLLLPAAARAAPQILRAEPVTAQILEEGAGLTNMLGFNGSTPGPELRLKQGEELNIQFLNQTDQPSSVHWHGIRLVNAMDGVPGLTQPVVTSGETFDYRFTLPDAGTYWYHSHNQSWEQVARGLYGPLIIEETTPPLIDHDITVILDDWRVDDSGALMEGFGNTHDFAHAGRLGNQAKALVSKSEAARGDRVRLRLINSATARVFPTRIEGIDGMVVALDGMSLESPRSLQDINLAPAQRVDVIGVITAPIEFLYVGRDGLYELGRIEAVGDNASPISDPIAPLPPPKVAQLGGAPDRKLSLRMEGGAMGGRHNGDGIWAFNGISGLLDEPWVRFERGETAQIELINDTRFSHGIHLHGHHFYELNEDGTQGDLRDTTLVAPKQSQMIAAVFDNPGRWLIHCHMLGHQASGMKTWIEVT